MKRAFVTGITGQDGSYIAEQLLEKGYNVFGFVRRVALEDKRHMMNRTLHVGLDYREYVVTKQGFFRPAEVDILPGDCSKAKEKLNWATEVSFYDLVAEMVENDLRSYSHEGTL